MGISLKPQHLNRYRQIGWLLAKYGRSDLVKETGLQETLTAEELFRPKEADRADELAAELRKSLMRELDYRQEAHNLAAFREQLKDFTHIIVPAPIADYSTSRALTMEYVPGVKITEMSPLTRMDFDGEMLAGELFRAYLNQILVEGFFHSDPHPGNVSLTSDHRIVLLVLGMIGRIMPVLQEALLQLLLAICEGH